MISANELMIGNWFYSKESIGYNPKGFIQVTSISTRRGVNGWQDMGASGEGKFSEIDPIPLTPEILEKAGFVNNKGYYDIKAIRRKLSILYLSDFWRVYYRSYDLVDIKYLHQLQNLYFALTGVELEIQL